MITTDGRPAAPADDVPRRLSNHPTFGDRIFRTLATAAAMASLVIVAATIYFLVKESLPALRISGITSFFTDSVWNGAVGTFGVFGLLVGTGIIAAIAMVVAVPLGVGMALFINEYAPPRVARFLTGTVDLLAALPSLIFGMWGRDTLMVRLEPIAAWMSEHLSAIPFFRVTGVDQVLVRSAFDAGIVVGIMVLPILTSVSRDVMAQTPREQCEGALALGGTRWGMIRAVVLPYGRSGIVGGILLGFGRALGETIAVALIIQLTFEVNWEVLKAGAGSVAALIATRFGEATPIERSGLVAAGLALLIVTFIVNLIARRIVNRSRIQ